MPGTYREALSSAVLITCLGSPRGPDTPQFCSVPGREPGPATAVTHHCRWKVWPQWMAATSREWSKKSEQMVHSARIGMMTGLKGIRQPRKPPPLRLRGRAPASPTGFKFGSTEQLPGTDRKW